jgi:hypothetical protein
MTLAFLAGCAASPAPSVPSTLDDARAIAAPDGSRFIICNPFSLNAVEIWKRDGDDVALEWAARWDELFPDAQPNAFIARVSRWDHSGRVDVTFSGAGAPFHTWIGTLTRDETGWHLRTQLAK